MFVVIEVVKNGVTISLVKKFIFTLIKKFQKLIVVEDQNTRTTKMGVQVTSL